MSQNDSDQPLVESPAGGDGQSLEPVSPPSDVAASVPSAVPQATFRGNTYDLIALGSLVTGALLLFSCLTCNMGYYCLPFISLGLGAVGVLSARQSVEAERTRLWSWLGIAAGGIVLLLIALFTILYIAFIVFAVVAGERFD